MSIPDALESTPSARNRLTLLYKQHKWLDIKEKPEESQLVTLALERIKQDPSQFDLFMKMLCGVKGMDLIVATLTGGELMLCVCNRLLALQWLLYKGGITTKLSKEVDVMGLSLKGHSTNQDTSLIRTPH